MYKSPFIQAVAFLLILIWARPSSGQSADAGKSPAARPRAAIAIWDTGQSSAEPLSSTALAAKEGWTLLPTGQPNTSIQGDVVMTNGRVLAVVRKRASAVDVYTEGDRGCVAQLRLHVLPTNGEPADHWERVSLVEYTKGTACLEAAYRTAKGDALTARFRVKRGEVFLQVEPVAGADRLRMDCPARFVVLPDFFADDMLIDAHTIPPSTAELPSENFLLHLAGKGDAIALCVFENRRQDAKIHLAGTGARRTITASEIGLEGKKVWVAVLEGSQVWHTRDVTEADAGKVLPLEWKMPFPAQWRVDWTRTNGLTDSWEMLLQEKKGSSYLKPTWLGAGADYLDANRRRWNTVLGTFSYPCWSDHEGHGYLQPLKSQALQFQGPLVLYPINRVKQTPLDAFTVVDIMRGTLGVGPCEYILDLEGQKAEYKGRATCSVRDELAAIYGKKQQKQQRARVEKILDDGLIFVKHIRGRITRYVEFGHKMRQYLAAQKKAHPELDKGLTELDALTQQIDARVAARADKIHTPAHVAAMNEEFRKNVRDDDGPHALENCKQYSTALVEIGDNQDELSAECRWVVKSLRQKAGLLLATEPRMAGIAAEIRARTQEALRNPANHEGAHH